jgi:hypothetical protein
VKKLLAGEKPGEIHVSENISAGIVSAIDFLPFGVEACRPALAMIVNDALQQSLIARKIDVEELFDDATRALAA